METIGFVGIGVMGKLMAANLLRAGYPLSIVSRHPEREGSLLAQGASAAASLQELARTCEVIIFMLPDTKTVEQVLFGDDGTIFGLRRGAVVIDMSTISPAETIEFAERLSAAGCAMLDAPVSGGQKGAESGTLGIMVGGPQDVFEKCRPILEVMGKTITYTGPSGSGQKTKLVNQLVAQRICSARWKDCALRSQRASIRRRPYRQFQVARLHPGCWPTLAQKFCRETSLLASAFACSTKT
jgi:3-hydroxyisobutyrate dehydrogenase-like beta-hydroxyacid dehydrogenase